MSPAGGAAIPDSETQDRAYTARPGRDLPVFKINFAGVREQA
jgi:hypothetical protein